MSNLFLSLADRTVRIEDGFIAPESNGRDAAQPQAAGAVP